MLSIEGKCNSSWVKSFIWNDGKLDITYKDGTVCRYEVDQETVRAFQRAESKGKFIHKYLINKEYEVL